MLLGAESLANADRLIDSLGLLHENFERQADFSPNCPALACGPDSLTYAQLERRANQLAHCLRERGIGRGDSVAILLPRSKEVYIALLGILKAGAAYVPLDVQYPADRIALILSDCRPAAVVTCCATASKLVEFSGQILRLDPVEQVLSAFSSERVPSAEVGTSPRDLCYIIYTSGTTGRPKGVAVEHRSVVHLVRVEQELFGVQASDRVYQGFSIAFDASVEEIWLAFCSGAVLVPATPEMLQAGPALADMLQSAGVTVLSCVPTLLAMLEKDVPSIRLLILGGEPCPPELVRRWWKPNRRVFNTYGPTEATVIATCAECHPNRQVTIGRPLPNYRAIVLDEDLRPVVQGATGELCLGGIGLARGYIGDEDLNRRKFISITVENGKPQTFYRTGDLVRWTAGGELEFLGRADTQVKIRGFRVELSEIESVLVRQPGVKAAAVALREDVPGLRQLVGYVVASDELDFRELRDMTRRLVPPYMVPAVIVALPELPTLTSGKVDRKALPQPGPNQNQRRSPVLSPRTSFQQQMAPVWQEAFAPLVVSVSDNFFSDLGGHSLLAARVVSTLRQMPSFEQISVADLYANPTIETLAAKFEKRAAQAPDGRYLALGAPQTDDGRAASPPSGIPFWRHFLCGTAQFVSLVFVLSFFALQWLAPYLTYTVFVEEEYGFISAVLAAFASLVFLYPVMLLVPIALKWLLIGRYRPGAFPLWGSYFFRFWLVRAIEAAVPIGYMKGTPLLSLYLRLMGARLGRNVQLHSDNFAIYDLLSIGDDSSVNADSILLGYTVENGSLLIGPISIGRCCFIGARAALCHNTAMEPESALEDLSLLTRGSTIPAGQTWHGSPAAPTSQVAIAKSDASASDQTQYAAGRSGASRHNQVGRAVPCAPLPAQNVEDYEKLAQSTAHRGLCALPPAGGNGGTGRLRPGRLRRFLLAFCQSAGLLMFPVLVVAALFPGIVVMNRLNYIDPYYWYLLLSPLAATSFVVFLCLEIAAAKWLLLGKIKAGRYRLDTFFYFRKWLVDRMMELSLDVLGPIYASVYLAPWYRLLGARLGSGAEISTASFISPDLLSIGAESFIADSVSLGAPRVQDGFMILGPNSIGKRTFIGNSALLPPHTILGDNVLIGCLSLPPRDPADALRQDSTWLGSPAIFLPDRQKSSGFDEERTFYPSIRLRIQRASIEFIRAITPSTCFIILTSLLFSALLLLHDHFTMVQTLLFFPLLYLVCGLAAALFTIAAKWVLVGRYTPGQKPLWSTFVWRNELLNALHEHLAEPFLVGTLTGTPFIAWYFRLLGTRVGRRTFIETTDFSEFDLAYIGDEASLNADCTIQTHLFEDRVMKMSRVQVGPRCSVGTGSLVLYDTLMQEGSRLDSLSLLMKGEILPAGTAWQGIPSQRCPLAKGQGTQGVAPL